MRERAPEPNTVHAEPVVVLLDTVQQVVCELHPQDARAVSPTLDSTLERDLGLDSLGRAELLTRLEHTFGVRLPEHLLATADTVRDLLRAVQGATAPGSPLVLPEVRRAIPEVAEAPPQHARTLVDVLEWHVHTHPQRLHITLSDAAEEITYAALYAGAQAVAAGLQARDLQPGHTVALMLPTCRHFFESFYGILLAGGIPVPLYPPLRPAQLAEHLRRQAGILQRTEDSGGFAGADVSKISHKAIARGFDQIGTLGSGNHYLEIQVVHPEYVYDAAIAQQFGITMPEQVVVMFHCGSRGFGHQVATDYLQVFLKVMQTKYGLPILDRELACAPFHSPEGQDYFAAMQGAANMAFANRQVSLHRIREVFSDLWQRDPVTLGLHMVYDVAHNTAKLEEHEVDGERR